MKSYIAVLHKDKNSDFGVSFPDFPGCITAGSTLEEAKEMAREVLPFHVSGLLADGDEIPEPMSLDSAASKSLSKTRSLGPISRFPRECWNASTVTPRPITSAEVPSSLRPLNRAWPGRASLRPELDLVSRLDQITNMTVTIHEAKTWKVLGADTQWDPYGVERIWS